MSYVKSQALLPCLGAQACTRVLHTMISARWIIRQSRRNTDHSTEKGWPITVWADLEEPRSEGNLILLFETQLFRFRLVYLQLNTL